MEPPMTPPNRRGPGIEAAPQRGAVFGYVPDYRSGRLTSCKEPKDRLRNVGLYVVRAHSASTPA